MADAQAARPVLVGFLGNGSDLCHAPFLPIIEQRRKSPSVIQDISAPEGATDQARCQQCQPTEDDQECHRAGKRRPPQNRSQGEQATNHGNGEDGPPNRGAHNILGGQMIEGHGIWSNRGLSRNRPVAHA
jgi:hypothetical protein